MSAADFERVPPAYNELSYNETLGGRLSWGIFGDDDQLGTMGLIGDRQVAAAASEIRRGVRFCLSLPLDEPNPPPADRPRYQHHMFRPSRNSQDDWLDGFYMQASSQWDGLRHVQAREFGFYNGISEADAAAPDGKLGVERWAQHGIVTRGLLADVKRFADAHDIPLPPLESAPISPDLLRETLAFQDSSPRQGDVLLVRTGYLTGLRGLPESERATWDHRRGCPGLVGSEAMAEMLWDWHIAAVCSDSPAVEVRPGSRQDGSLHRRVIPMLGMALGELFDLDALAEDCANDGRYTSFFISAPLNLPGGVGSPANAMACK